MARRSYSHSLPLPPLYNYILLGLGGLAILVIILVVYYSLSGATITVKPAWQEQKIGLIANIIDQKLGTTTANQLPGYLKTYEREVSEMLPASSSTVSNTPISGNIEIANHSSKSQALIATTRFITADNLLFRLDKAVTVPAGGKVTASITASEKDDKFLIGQAPTNLTIPGLWPGLQDKIYGVTTGQFQRKASAAYQITPENITSAQDLLQQKAIAAIKTELAQTEEKISDEQIIITENTLKTDDQPDANGLFKASLKIKAVTVIFDASKLPDLAASNIPDVYKSNNIKIKIIPDSFNYKLTLLDSNSENLLAQIHGEYKLQIANYTLATDALVGLKKSVALELLKNNGQYESYSIKLPFWSATLPKNKEKIKIIFQ